jgi:hypothetical protein
MARRFLITGAAGSIKMRDLAKLAVERGESLPAAYCWICGFPSRGCDHLSDGGKAT